MSIYSFYLNYGSEIVKLLKLTTFDKVLTILFIKLKFRWCSAHNNNDDFGTWSQRDSLFCNDRSVLHVRCLNLLRVPSQQCPPHKLRSEVLSNGNQVMQLFNLLGLAKGKWFPQLAALKSTSIYQAGGPKATGLIFWFKCPSLSTKFSLKYELAAKLLNIKLLLWSK